MPAKKQRSQAERAANPSGGGKKKNNQSTSRRKGSPQRDERIPVRVITSIAFLVLFILLLLTLIIPEGTLVKALNSFIHGMFGRVAFIILVPALFCMFMIHAFSRGRPVLMRTISLFSFVVSCGCLAQLTYSRLALTSFKETATELYYGGIERTTAGFLCGGLAEVVRSLCGNPLSYIFFTITALLTLLASVQITIPSIVRAFRNCPQMKEGMSKPEPQEPAEVIVNHIAERRMARLQQKEAKKHEVRAEIEEKFETEDDLPEEETEVIAPVAKPKKIKTRADEIMTQIDGDVENPVAAAGERVISQDEVDILSGDMPSFDSDEITEDLPVKTQPQIINEPKKEKVAAKDTKKAAAEIAAEIAEGETLKLPEYCYPPVELLKAGANSSQNGSDEMFENTRRLNETLASFKIEAHIVNVTRGPSVTRYEVELEKGVRLNKLTTTADDIALSLGATGVRIAAIPGKSSVVGIEVPNRAVSTVSLRDVIDSSEFKQAKSKSSFAVGKDIGGNSIVGNISKLPHMLIAGTTGSGKSVCMNSVIISLLYKASPDDVKLIMVDPKMVELGIYNGIPHLLIPVVTDPKKAAGSLQWAVTEMLKRYKAMSDVGVRDLESYNSMVASGQIEGNRLPQVVVIIDELADLMLVAAKEVEESICRIAQMGRAAGIHLIIATQRPSADVITGLMKANIPSRIAFAVASAMESRIILDAPGAEKLVGKGDMLFAPIGSGKPKRVQGCFVSDAEVEAVATYVKTNFTSNYDQEIMEEIEKKAAQTGNKPASNSEVEPSPSELDGDEMLPAAVDVILETGQASVSMLQRRLKLGYARAARIVDEMEEKGIVGPFVGSKPRTILITKEQWASMCNGGITQMDFEDIDADDAITTDD